MMEANYIELIIISFPLYQFFPMSEKNLNLNHHILIIQ